MYQLELDIALDDNATLEDAVNALLEAAGATDVSWRDDATTANGWPIVTFRHDSDERLAAIAYAYANGDVEECSYLAGLIEPTERP